LDVESAGEVTLQVIGVAGRKFHGKDTVSRELVLHGFSVVRFAGPLKAMLRAFYVEHGITAEVIERKIEGDLKEVPCPLLLGKTPRYAMQTLGHDWGRVLIAQDLWTESFNYRVGAVEKAVVPDTRYANEVETIKNLGGEVWRVEAKRRVPENEHSNHPSEVAIDTLSVDREIDNNGTPEELTNAIQAALALPG
jgi:hypothetical protein